MNPQLSKAGNHQFASFGSAVIAMALFLFSGATPLHAAQGPATTPVAMTLDPGRRAAVLEIPAECTRVVVERRPTPASPWIRYRILAAKAAQSTVRIGLPKTPSQTEWRATGILPPPPIAARKYPAVFYRGAHSFTATMAPSYSPGSGVLGRIVAGDIGPVSDSSISLLTTGAVSSLPNKSADLLPTTTAAAAVEESDIWKVDGTTVYFFNQLRGLQVIDLSDPANPVLNAALRLPASGQDLYVVPGEGAVRYAILLTRSYRPPTYLPRTGVKVVKVEGKSAQVVSETAMDGWMSDSRIVGNRLYLVTHQWDASVLQTTLHEFVVNAGTLEPATTHGVSGSDPIVAAGPGWLAILTSDSSDWQSSLATLFSLDPNGATQLNASPIAVSGRVYDKFKVQYAKGSLSVISQRWEADPTRAWWWTSPVATLENFTAAGIKQASLEIVRGEQLYATAFAGNKAYVVTFRNIDPLWVIDLADASNPFIAGHVQVPGWSTHIEAFGDLLFSIGYDQGQVAASLFDVSDSSAPALLKRVKIEGFWGSSEALYDEKALKVLPEEGLALIPFTRYTSEGTEHSVQLLDLDLSGRDLRQRGAIAHNFEPRRAAVVGASLASISQRQLVTANISDRDKPLILADLLLAWPVNRLIAAGNFLIEIADGNSWSASNPVARIADVSNPDSILQEVELRSGSVRDAVLKDGKLYVLSQTQSLNRYYVFMMKSASSSASPVASGTTPSIYLDIYDAAALPTLSLLGSTSSAISDDYYSWEVGKLLWASPTTPLAITQPQSWYNWGGPVLRYAPLLAVDNIAPLNVPATRIYPGYWIGMGQPAPASALVFQVQDPTAPSALKPIPLTQSGDSSIHLAVADANLLVFGYGNQETFPSESSDISSSRHHLGVLDLNQPSLPLLRPALDLPGRLFGITDLSRDGFLAWTESRSGGKKFSEDRQIQVSAWDGADVFQVARLKLAGGGTMVADGRNLFAVESQEVKRYELSNAAVLTPKASIKLDWVPYNLQPIPGGLLGDDWSQLFRASWSEQDKGEVIEWDTTQRFDLSLAVPLPDQSVLAPVGDYGVDRFEGNPKK